MTRFHYIVGIGASLWPEENLPKLLSALASGFHTTKIAVSRIRLTEPVAPAVDPYLNAVVVFCSDEDQAAVCRAFDTIESDVMGRPLRGHPKRGPAPGIPVTADLDLLCCLGENEPRLKPSDLCKEDYHRAAMVEAAHIAGIDVSQIPLISDHRVKQITLSGSRVGMEPFEIRRNSDGSLNIVRRRAALVTGGAIRLGKAIALHLAKSGFDIALHFKSSSNPAEETSKEITALGRTCISLRQDLSQLDSLRTLIDRAAHSLPHLSLLVNSASAYESGQLHKVTPSQLHEQFNVNTFAPILLTRHFAQRVGHGAIVNILDSKIALNDDHYVSYMLSKKSLADFTLVSSIALAPNIRVNGVGPGVVLPAADRTPEYIAWRAQGIPLKRAGKPEDIGEMVRVLAESEFVTGQIVYVDGGEAANFVGRNLLTFGPGASLLEQPIKQGHVKPSL